MGASCSAAVQSRPRRREISVGQLLPRHWIATLPLAM